MEKDEYLASLNNYYNLKHKYENTIKNSKYTLIKNNDLTKKEKRNKFLKKKKRCVNCQQEGGSIFTITKKSLTAICGNKNTPCDLNINIKKKHYTKSNDLSEILYDEINDIKKNIIKNKMDLIYQYKTEEEIVDNFTELKEDLTNLSLSYEEALHHYFNVVDNKLKKDELKKYKTDFYNILIKINELNEQYKEEKNIDLLKSSIDIYKSNIIPLVKQIQSVKYKENYLNVEEKSNEKEYHLVQNEYTISDLEIEI